MGSQSLEQPIMPATANRRTTGIRVLTFGYFFMMLSYLYF
ncbi:hypothetical protein C943_01851 [Mariniradius saccharolyticus AK6]|uniref:Uncharacterized protein n=1 Tax=Mariniradius saccharolyticus AK6 TaxID=1239962 RepID=M7XTT9_9BACT|nr:hypothetical protein C943_01851 [Mariniradius saccharolyticus AK6]